MSAPPNTEPMLPDIMGQIPEPPAAPPSNPLFIVAYWPRDKRWKIQGGMYSISDASLMKHDVDWLQNNGWTHITVLRLPEKLWKL